MAVARLSRVTLSAPVAELGRLVGEIMRFGRFHPSRREGLAQDIHILLFASRAQAVYARATELLGDERLKAVRDVGRHPSVPRSPDLAVALSEFEEELEVIERTLPLLTDAADRRTVADILLGAQVTSRELFNALQRLLVATGPPGAVTLEGYVPARFLEELRRELGGHLLRAEPVDRRGPEEPYLPTLLVNPRLVSLFERFTLERGIPRYSEIDPTPLVALVFPLFFGIMFADVGHGLALLLFGFYLYRRTRYVYWGQLIVVFGSAATLVGLARGAFFGVTFPTPLSAVLDLPPVVSATLTFAYVPLLLEAAIVVGTFHLTSAYVISVLNQIRSNRYREALTRGVPTLLLYAGLVPLGFALLGAGLNPQTVLSSPNPTPFFLQFLGVSVPVSTTALVALPFVLGPLAVLIAEPPITRYIRSHDWRKTLRSFGGGLIEALSRPVEFLMNTLSYIRLAALLIANTLLGSLVGRALGLGVAGILLAVLLNLVLMAMEGLIVYLQDMRLHYLEWFSKFYAGTGTAFDPVRFGAPGR